MKKNKERNYGVCHFLCACFVQDRSKVGAGTSPSALSARKTRGGQNAHTMSRRRWCSSEEWRRRHGGMRRRGEDDGAREEKG
ncbi:hypothetical protein DM860_005539 [Cuscuta australis]|uniref:Uncharacterized protein n=1 Tax=Cuscuta australis TaxID=267555 RepID=A0A328E3X9_9ASTE|nr:hypothetical protein DM860_005539 [Cuscuta australis]